MTELEAILNKVNSIDVPTAEETSSEDTSLPKSADDIIMARKKEVAKMMKCIGRLCVIKSDTLADEIHGEIRDVIYNPATMIHPKYKVQVEIGEPARIVDPKEITIVTRMELTPYQLRRREIQSFKQMFKAERDAVILAAKKHIGDVADVKMRGGELKRCVCINVSYRAYDCQPFFDMAPMDNKEKKMQYIRRSILAQSIQWLDIPKVEHVVAGHEMREEKKRFGKTAKDHVKMLKGYLKAEEEELLQKRRKCRELREEISRLIAESEELGEMTPDEISNLRETTAETHVSDREEPSDEISEISETTPETRIDEILL
jgi:hypothetical protein